MIEKIIFRGTSLGGLIQLLNKKNHPTLNHVWWCVSGLVGGGLLWLSCMVRVLVVLLVVVVVVLLESLLVVELFIW
jgi:hypothetical protein